MFLFFLFFFSGLLEIRCFKASIASRFLVTFSFKKTSFFLSRLGRYLFGPSFPFFSCLHVPVLLDVIIFSFFLSFSQEKVSSFLFSCTSFKYF